MRPRRLRRVAAALSMAAPLVLASCATSIPPTNYYVLGLSNSPAQTAVESSFPYTLAIAPFESESIYLRKKIVWRSGPNRLGYYSYDKWAALPAEMFSYRLYERAQSSGLFKSVVSDAASGSADLILRGRITAFEEVDTPEGWFGRVEVEAELTQSDGTVLWSGVAGHTEPAAEQSVQATVKAISRATEATITALLSSVEQALRDRQQQ